VVPGAVVPPPVDAPVFGPFTVRATLDGLKSGHPYGVFREDREFGRHVNRGAAELVAAHLNAAVGRGR
jgi:hypothetical protein